MRNKDSFVYTKLRNITDLKKYNRYIKDLKIFWKYRWSKKKNCYLEFTLFRLLICKFLPTNHSASSIMADNLQQLCEGFHNDEDKGAYSKILWDDNWLS